MPVLSVCTRSWLPGQLAFITPGSDLQERSVRDAAYTAMWSKPQVEEAPDRTECQRIGRSHTD